MSVPAIRYLKGPAGFRQVDVLVGSWTYALAKKFGVIDGVISADLPWWSKERGYYSNIVRAVTVLRKLRSVVRGSEYDYIIDLRGDIRHVLLFMVNSGAYTMATRRAGVERFVHRALPDVSGDEPVGLQIFRAVSSAFPAQASDTESRPSVSMARAGGRTLGMYVSARLLIKEWPYERYLALARLAQAEWPGARFYLFAGADRRDEFHRLLDLFERNGLRTIAFFNSSWDTVFEALEDCWAVVGPDSALGHLAGLLGVPTVTLFGPAKPSDFAPTGPALAEVVYNGAPCSPCLQTACVRRQENGVPQCMDTISPHQVFHTLQDLYRRLPRNRFDGCYTSSDAESRGRT